MAGVRVSAKDHMRMASPHSYIPILSKTDNSDRTTNETTMAENDRAFSEIPDAMEGYADVSRPPSTPRHVLRISGIIDLNDIAVNGHVESPSGQIMTREEYANHPDRPLTLRERQQKILQRVREEQEREQQQRAALAALNNEGETAEQKNAAKKAKSSKKGKFVEIGLEGANEERESSMPSEHSEVKQPEYIPAPSLLIKTQASEQEDKAHGRMVLLPLKKASARKDIEGERRIWQKRAITKTTAGEASGHEITKV